MPEKELSRTASRPVFNTYALTVCALLTLIPYKLTADESRKISAELAKRRGEQ